MAITRAFESSQNGNGRAWVTIVGVFMKWNIDFVQETITRRTSILTQYVLKVEIVTINDHKQRVSADIRSHTKHRDHTQVFLHMFQTYFITFVLWKPNIVNVVLAMTTTCAVSVTEYVVFTTLAQESTGIQLVSDEEKHEAIEQHECDVANDMPITSYPFVCFAADSVSSVDSVHSQEVHISTQLINSHDQVEVNLNFSEKECDFDFIPQLKSVDVLCNEMQKLCHIKLCLN